MDYRGPDFLAGYDLAPFPSPPVSKLDWRYTGRDWERETTCWRERKGGNGEEPIIRPARKPGTLVFIIINSLWRHGDEATKRRLWYIARGDISTSPIPSGLKWTGHFISIFWDRWKTNISTTTLDYAFDVDQNLIPNEEILRHSENLNYFFSRSPGKIVTKTSQARK